ncbi:hypothetical protein EDD17DRAFT_1503915 [Pisolithus thermaeus]|nr:hypothetical protein EV401DRAFT_2201156 [Pisolithus croceorrhizus]KAI6167668.1 hypothetical protein EDD17DRAFT_1503915 [Pisolithus thermaeus]
MAIAAYNPYAREFEEGFNLQRASPWNSSWHDGLEERTRSEAPYDGDDGVCDGEEYKKQCVATKAVFRAELSRVSGTQNNIIMLCTSGQNSLEHGAVAVQIKKIFSSEHAPEFDKVQYLQYVKYGHWSDIAL